MTDQKQIMMDEELFSEIIVQVGILKEMYDKIEVNKQMNLFQKRVLLKNKKSNVDVLKKLEKMCETL